MEDELEGCHYDREEYIKTFLEKEKNTPECFKKKPISKCYSCILSKICSNFEV